LRSREECGNERVKERAFLALAISMGGGGRSSLSFFGWIGK